MPLTQCHSMYIHSSYKSIARNALFKDNPSRKKCVIVTGTPGTRKSVFIYYVKQRLIEDKKLECHTLPNKFDRQFWSTDGWCLVDAVGPTKMTELPHGQCSILLACTPQRDCIDDFMNLVPVPEVFCLPLWTKDELAAIVHLTLMQQCLRGIPRLVLQDIQTDTKSLLMSACNYCSLDDTISMVSVDSPVSQSAKHVQRLIQMQSEEPYREYKKKVVYASELAVEVVAEKKWRLDSINMQCHLGSCYGNSLAQSLCSFILEPYALDLLDQGGTFICRELESGRKRMFQLAVRVTDIAFDAWMSNFGGIQMVMGKTHDIKNGAVADLAKLGPSCNRLYFCFHHTTAIHLPRRHLKLSSRLQS
ncbi:Crinkler (CRN) family protein [Phytophthora palmivora]|uniref:Crinkler (CRN) family protein n=1 Tax=Phytophthora palmivora TaxID=4796 RepID=A0A2P4XDK1_9STRA|nr:Crinkler (CRN) family protein [Phytophthora palmivora]